MKERVLKVKINVEPDVRPRILHEEDKYKIRATKQQDFVTLWEHKELYPYELHNSLIVTVTTNLSKFSFKIKEGYCYDGASIPRPLHTLIGSNGEPKFLIPALLHDFLLEKMRYIYNETLKRSMSVKDFRKLTTDIFKYELEYYGTKPVKASIMANCVQMWQCTGSRKQWNELNKI